MAYAPHLLVQFGGTLVGTEEWVCTIRQTNNGSSTLQTPYEWCTNNLEDVAGDVSTFFQSSMIGNEATLVYTKYNPIDAQGHYIGPETLRHDYPSPVVNGSSGLFPPQIAWVVSFQTDKSRGRAHAGRMYLPAPNPIFDADSGQVNTSNAVSQRDAARTFVVNLNNFPGPDTGDRPKVAIFSRIDGSFEQVTAVRMGKVLDTQRRRRRQLDEHYTDPVDV